MQGFLKHLAQGRYGGNIVHQRSTPARPARWADPTQPLDPRIRDALAGRGADRLYEHQALALDALAQGEHVMVVTPTASGKSLIYQVPAIDAALRSPAGRSLFLFPFKALAQDQFGAFGTLSRDVSPLNPPRAEIYDGDTTPERRRRIRADLPDVLLTNPDMLHLGILANHHQWTEFFRALRYVVVDELHVYRGILGGHLHHVIRRLRRLCRHYGSNPQFLVCSATVANPGPFAEMLIGVPFTVVQRSGAPQAKRNFILLNPPASPYTAAAHLLTEAMDAGLRTIAFTKARRITELVQRWITGERPDLRNKLAAYRAGYLAEERRGIERRLFTGDLLGVISTSALELGVDVGGLDVCILVGYPGSIVRFWQRLGRVGRRGRESLVILVGMPDALDQYFLKHPDEFFERSFEEAVANPTNATISRAHLLCAGAELPLSAVEEEPELQPGTLARAREMARDGELVLDAEGKHYYSLRRRPQRDVNLRSGGQSFAIVEAPKNRLIGQIDGVRVFHECHPGAIYLHAGAQYRVEHLDIDRRKVVVARCNDDYYTEVASEKETEILEVHQEGERGMFRAGLGRLRVTEEIKGYHRRRLFRQEVLSTEPLDLPPLVFETVGLWIDLPDAIRDGVVAREGHFMGAIHALEHTAISLFPLLAISDRGDIGGISYPMHPQIGRAAVFIYDGYPGGVGLSARGFEELERLLDRTRDLLEDCECESGCPSCVHSPKCGNGNKPLDKESALWTLRVLTGREPLPELVLPAAPLPMPPPQPVREWKPAAQEQEDATVGTGAAGRRPTPVPAAGAPATQRTSASRPRPAGGQGYRPERPPPAPSPRHREQPGDRVLAFDLETQRSAEEVGGWWNLVAMGLALAVVQDLGTGEMRSYREKEVQALIIDLLSADLVVGYNVRRFDYGVLEGYASPGTFRRVPTVDMLERIHEALGFRIKLDAVAQATLGARKSADGLQSLQWFKEGRLDLIEDYCKQDVRVTGEIYRFGRRHGYLLYPDREGRHMRVPVDW